MKVIISGPAQKDIEKRIDYLMQNSYSRFLDDFRIGLSHTLENLSLFENLGQKVDANESLRCKNFGDYHLYYLIFDDIVQVLRVTHHLNDEPDWSDELIEFDDLWL